MPLDFAGPSNIVYEYLDDSWLERPLFERFEYIAMRYAGQTAVDDGTLTLSYSALLIGVRTLAEQIAALTPPGRPVAILLPHCAHFPMVALACLAIGRPYVPIDSRYPPDRIDDVFREIGAAAVVLDRSANTARRFPSGLKTIDLSSLLLSSGVSTIVNASAQIAVDAPGVILYTSGSTGKPKGICNSQRGLLQRIAASVNAYHAHPDDRMILLSSFSTIAGQRETLAALLSGATLHIADLHKLGIGGVLQLMQRNHITICYAVPALMRSLLRATGAGEAFADLRIMRVAGDVTLANDLTLLRSILPDTCHFLVSFGSTEMPTVFQWFVPPDWRADTVRLPAGYALAGTHFSVISENGLPVSAGESGELIVRSRYLALGQWQDGELQAGAFQPDSDDPSIRILHTGDLMALRSDGLWEFVGRKDRQIKIRGQRIHPGEIEAALRTCAEVEDAAVIPRSDGEEVVALVAYVVPRHSSEDGVVDRIKLVLPTRLSRHLLPSEIVLLDAIPQLPGLKTNYRALENIELAARSREAASVVPTYGEFSVSAGTSRGSETASTQIRDAVESAWTAVFGASSYQMNQAWDQTGGDSLKAMELWFHIEQTLHCKITLDALDEGTTPARLGQAIAHYFNRQTEPRIGASGASVPVVFLMPGILGDEPLLAQFRAALGAKIHFKVITYPEPRNEKGYETGLREIVDAAYAQICAEPTCAPYYLVGYSFGGYVAFETARSLIDNGNQVGFLGLIDSRMSDMSTAQVGRLGELKLQIQRTYPLLAAPASLAALLGQRWKRLQRWLWWVATARPTTAIAFTFHRERNYRHRISALRRWKLKPVEVDATLYLSDGRLSDSPPDYAWGQLCKNLTLVPIGGTHSTMMEAPRRAILSAHLLAALHADADRYSSAR